MKNILIIKILIVPFIKSALITFKKVRHSFYLLSLQFYAPTHQSILFLIFFLFSSSPLILKAQCLQEVPKLNELFLEYQTKIQAEIKKLDQEPILPLDKEWVTNRVHLISQIDDQMHNFYNNIFQDTSISLQDLNCFRKVFEPEFHKIEKLTVQEIKDLLIIRDWFNRSEFDQETEKKAWLIIQHADFDRDLQIKVLKTLSQLYPKGKTDPLFYASLTDRVAASWLNPKLRVPQRYGTQGYCNKDKIWTPLESEDPRLLNQRRLDLGLEPIEDYQRSMTESVCKNLRN